MPAQHREAWMRGLRTGFLALGVFVCGAVDADAMSASFRWCAGSPEFTLSGVPAGAANLRFAMTDLDVPGYDHGGGTIRYDGVRTIPCGAFSGAFKGPSPPPGQVHRYRWKIEALGANGKALATTSAQRKYPE
jgi:phosphatidylethanolamine-binding protein (PEBP) family uncharacterized protein